MSIQIPATLLPLSPPPKQERNGMRRFVVKHRDRGPTVVAEGVKFSDGTLAVRWNDDGFTQNYKSLPELLQWERTYLAWIDL